MLFKEKKKTPDSIVSAQEFYEYLCATSGQYVHEMDIYLKIVNQIHVDGVYIPLADFLIRKLWEEGQVSDRTLELVKRYLNPIFDKNLGISITSPKQPEKYINRFIEDVLYPTMMCITNADSRRKYTTTFQVECFIKAIFNNDIPTKNMHFMVSVLKEDLLELLERGEDTLFRSLLDERFRLYEKNYGIAPHPEAYNEAILLKHYAQRILSGDSKDQYTFIKACSTRFHILYRREMGIQNVISTYRNYLGDAIDGPDCDAGMDIVYMCGKYFDNRPFIVSNSSQIHLQITMLKEHLSQILFSIYNRIPNGLDRERNAQVIVSFVRAIIREYLFRMEYENDSYFDEAVNHILYQFRTHKLAVEAMGPYEDPYCRIDPPEDLDEVAMEAYDKRSAKLQSTEAKIYHAYKNYKNSEQKVDSQITKMVQAAKKLAIGDTRTEIIEGKKFSAIGLLKKALSTAAIFAFGPIKGLILLVIKYALKGKTTAAERKKILLELQVELDMITEKIEDAKGDGNRQAKYAMMRTKAELEAAIAKIRYGVTVDEKMLEGASKALSNPIGKKGKR